MRKWLALGLLGLVVVWAPFVYSELRRKPVSVQSQMNAAIADDHAFEPAPAAEPAAPSEPQPVAAPAAAAREPVPEEPATEARTPMPPTTVEASPEPTLPAAAQQAVAAHEEPPVEGLPAELAPEFQRTFDSEPRDAFWAGDEEPRLRGLFHGAGVPDSALSEVACRKTVCRVEFSGNIERAVESKLYTRVREEFGRMLALDVRPSEGAPQASLYVLRQGYRLEPTNAR